MAVNHYERKRQLVELVNSPGWQICRDILGRQLTELAIQLGRNLNIDHSRVDHMRGQIFAMEHLMSLPDRLADQEEMAIRTIEAKEKPHAE